MTYDTPGNADQVSQPIQTAWNARIQSEYDRLAPQLGSRFFTLDPMGMAGAVESNAVKWFGDPAEPVHCVGRRAARELSDWGVRGRHELHNEYCEYAVIRQLDPASGRMRPKRVEVTTELREYWLTLARLDPDTLRTIVADVLGFQPSWTDLYGVSDPHALGANQREQAFANLVAGDGRQTQPVGRLNTERALFMTHPINGLDDLLYIVLFGARPYARRVGGLLQPATRDQIFREFDVEQLACRHADPAAASGAHAQAFEGRTVAFANPLGMYIHSFAQGLFSYQNQPVPGDWVRFSRGTVGRHQRLEFGPPDSHAAFLDDIVVDANGTERPLTGGYQVVQQIEVGPWVLIGQPTPVANSEYVEISVSDAPIVCGGTSVCQRIRSLKDEYDQGRNLARVAPRVMGRIG